MSEQLVGKFRRDTTFSVSFPTLPSLKVLPKYVDLIQKQYKHDVLILDYKTMSPKWIKLLKTGVPVKFTWKQGTRQKVWFGYISTVKRMNKARGLLPMQIHCTGASFVLKKRSNKTYKNKTIPEVAALIAKKNGLKFIGENHSRRFSQLSVSGHSQWEWLHEQARRIGYAMYIDGTNLVFRPIDKLIDAMSSDAPLFQYWDSQIPKSYHFLDRTLDGISILNGENVEDTMDARAIKTVSGVHPTTGKAFHASKSPSKTGKALRSKVSDTLFEEHQSHQVTSSSKEAKEAAEGAAHLARFNLPANANGQGDPRVRPYSLVYIQGLGEVSDGHWLVRSSHHKFKYGGDYLLEMKIATDGTEQNSKKSEPSIRRNDRVAVGTVNLEQILSGLSAFGAGQSLRSLGLGTQSKSSEGTTRLSMKDPMLTNVSNQGFDRTPTRWQTTKPSDANLGKCGCDC